MKRLRFSHFLLFSLGLLGFSFTLYAQFNPGREEMIREQLERQRFLEEGERANELAGECLKEACSYGQPMCRNNFIINKLMPYLLSNGCPGAAKKVDMQDFSKGAIFCQCAKEFEDYFFPTKKVENYNEFLVDEHFKEQMKNVEQIQKDALIIKNLVRTGVNLPTSCGNLYFTNELGKSMQEKGCHIADVKRRLRKTLENNYADSKFHDREIFNFNGGNKRFFSPTLMGQSAMNIDDEILKEDVKKKLERLGKRCQSHRQRMEKLCVPDEDAASELDIRYAQFYEDPLAAQYAICKKASQSTIKNDVDYTADLIENYLNRGISESEKGEGSVELSEEEYEKKRQELRSESKMARENTPEDKGRLEFWQNEANLFVNKDRLEEAGVTEETLESAYGITINEEEEAEKNEASSEEIAPLAHQVEEGVESYTSSHPTAQVDSSKVHEEEGKTQVPHSQTSSEESKKKTEAPSTNTPSTEEDVSPRETAQTGNSSVEEYSFAGVREKPVEDSSQVQNLINRPRYQREDETDPYGIQQSMGGESEASQNTFSPEDSYQNSMATSTRQERELDELISEYEGLIEDAKEKRERAKEEEEQSEQEEILASLQESMEELKEEKEGLKEEVRKLQEEREKRQNSEEKEHLAENTETAQARNSGADFRNRSPEDSESYGARAPSSEREEVVVNSPQSPQASRSPSGEREELQNNEDSSQSAVVEAGRGSSSSESGGREAGPMDSSQVNLSPVELTSGAVSSDQYLDLITSQSAVDERQFRQLNEDFFLNYYEKNGNRPLVVKGSTGERKFYLPRREGQSVTYVRVEEENLKYALESGPGLSQELDSAQQSESGPERAPASDRQSKIHRHAKLIEVFKGALDDEKNQ